MKTYLEKNFVFLLISMAILIAFAFLSKPTRTGDGHEYSLIAQAFVNHLTPDIRIEDVEVRERQIKNFQNNGYVQQIFDDLKKGIEVRTDQNAGVYRANNQKYYGYHFWLYPGFVAVIEKITIPFGANPLAGFQIANAILFCFVFLYVYFGIEETYEKKLTICASFVLGGALFYLKWTHPEVFISALLFVGFLSLFKKSLKTTFCCFALASIQVVSLWVVFAVIPVFIFIQ